MYLHFGAMNTLHMKHLIKCDQGVIHLFSIYLEHNIVVMVMVKIVEGVLVSTTSQYVGNFKTHLAIISCCNNVLRMMII